MVYLCSLCRDFVSRYFVKVLHHIGAVHSYGPHFQVQCGIDSCPKTYKKYTSWRKHILCQHRHIFRDDVEPRDEHCQPSFSENCDRGNEEEFDRHTCTSLELAAISGNHLSLENSLENSFSRQKAALFLLKAKECLKVSQSALESLIDDVSSISSAQVQILKNKVTFAVRMCLLTFGMASMIFLRNHNQGHFLMDLLQLTARTNTLLIILDW